MIWLRDLMGWIDQWLYFNHFGRKQSTIMANGSYENQEFRALFQNPCANWPDRIGRNRFV
jgi:hypothetical protein